MDTKAVTQLFAPSITPGPRNCLKRWPLLIVAFGWSWLAVSSYRNEFPASLYLEQPYWWMGAAICAGLTIAFFFEGGTVLRRLAASASIAYATSRGLAYLLEGVQTYIAVWLIVIGTTLIGYRVSVRAERQ